METAICVDLLRRAEIAVTLAGVEGPGAVRCSRGVQLVPDVALSEVTGRFDVLVLPGGAGGAECLAASPQVGALLQTQAKHGFIAAICAAPIALLAHGVGRGRRVTSHPSVRERLAGTFELCDDRVVIDGRLITSQGPGTSFEFALAIISELRGADVATKVRAPLCLPTQLPGHLAT